MSFEDLKIIISEDETIHAKLCKVRGFEYFDFRLLEKVGDKTKPTKNGMCLPRVLMYDVGMGLSDLLAGEQKRKVIGPCSIWMQDKLVRVEKGDKRCCLTIDQAEWVMNALMELDDE